MIPLLERILITRPFIFEGTLIAFDPGNTTGYSVFHVTRSPETANIQQSVKVELVEAGQLATEDIDTATKEYLGLILKYSPSYIVTEDYRIYGWKTEQHSFSDVLTLRLVGAIETICSMRGITVSKQMAQIAKGFCTDDKLKTWNLWIKGKRHARDSIRHAIYWILFTYVVIKNGEKK